MSTQVGESSSLFDCSKKRQVILTCLLCFKKFVGISVFFERSAPGKRRMILFTKLHRSYTVVFFKKLGKVIRIIDSAVLGDGLYLKLGGAQEFSGSIHAPGCYIVRDGFSRLFMKQGTEIAGVEALQVCKCVQAQVARKIGIDIGDCFLNERGILIGRVLPDQTAVRVYHIKHQGSSV